MGETIGTTEFVNQINAFITSKDYHWLFAAIKGFRNGIIYGTRIRFPHALVITFMFGKGSFRQKVTTIAHLTRTHAWNLAKFVFTFKLGSGGLSAVFGGKAEWQVLLAGTVAGYIHFGDMNAVNSQLMFYLLSRTLTGLAKLASKKGLTPPELTLKKIFPYLSASLWSVCLWMFIYYPEVLQHSMVTASEYLYLDSDHFDCWQDLILYNKLPK